MGLLTVEKLTVRFGGLVAIRDVSMSIEEGEIRALIGPNGAGKTTVLNTISGIYQPDAGKVRYGDVELSRLKPHEISGRGITRTFQTAQVFKGLTALENVMLGLHPRLKSGLFASALGLPGAKREEEEARRKALELLKFLGLERFNGELASNLAYGQRKLLELARALVGDPRVLLLDEPAGGMNLEEIDEMNTVLRLLNERRGITIVLVEHVMRMVMAISHRVTVLDFGEKIADGTVDEVRRDPKVIEAYLGKGRVGAAS